MRVQALLHRLIAFGTLRKIAPKLCLRILIKPLSLPLFIVILLRCYDEALLI